MPHKCLPAFKALPKCLGITSQYLPALPYIEHKGGHFPLACYAGLGVHGRQWPGLCSGSFFSKQSERHAPANRCFCYLSSCPVGTLHVAAEMYLFYPVCFIPQEHMLVLWEDRVQHVTLAMLLKLPRPQFPSIPIFSGWCWMAVPCCPPHDNGLGSTCSCQVLFRVTAWHDGWYSL